MKKKVKQKKRKKSMGLKLYEYYEKQGIFDGMNENDFSVEGTEYLYDYIPDIPDEENNRIRILPCAGLYAVSELGEIWNLSTGEKLKPVENTNHYYRVSLPFEDKKGKKYKNVYIHQISCAAFRANPKHKPQVNHTTERKYVNDPLELEWVTASENQKYGTGSQRRAMSRKYGEKVSWDNY